MSEIVNFIESYTRHHKTSSQNVDLLTFVSKLDTQYRLCKQGFELTLHL